MPRKTVSSRADKAAKRYSKTMSDTGKQAKPSVKVRPTGKIKSKRVGVKVKAKF